MSKILLSGGCGFIGSHLVELLVKKGHSVVVIDNLSTGHISKISRLMSGRPSAELQHINLDINDINKSFSNIQQRTDFDIVFHLAGQASILNSIEDPVKYHRDNVSGTVEMLEFARKQTNLQRFVYTASSSCYGPTDLPSITEEAPINPTYPYSLTKYLGEQYVEHYRKVYGVPTISARLFNVYGPRMGMRGGAIPTFLAQLKNDMPLAIIGDGSNSRDFIYVKDVVKALIALVEPIDSKDGYVVNICSGNSTSIYEIIQNLVEYTREAGWHDKEFHEYPILHMPERKGEPKTLRGSSGLIERIFYGPIRFEQWPITNIHQGLKATVEAEQDTEYPKITIDAIMESTKDWYEVMNG